MAAVPDGVAVPEQTLERKQRAENFPVALRLLPRKLRADLIAVYGFARTVDDLGDEAAGNRTALLEAFRADLVSVWTTGRPTHPVLQQLVPTVAARGLDREPFDRLVQANLVDQQVHRYATYGQLRQYCTLSADPVGRIVLGVFGLVDRTELTELSDRVCTALQLIEHWQDVAEDRRAGRVYLPQEDLAAYGVSEAELDAPPAGGRVSPALRALMSFEIHRAAELLDSGAPLLGMLHGWARLAVAGYVAGGRAALDALRRSDGDIFGVTPRPRRRDVLRHLWVALQGRPTRPAAGSNARQPQVGR
jgi:squalene synthase HpnC